MIQDTRIPLLSDLINDLWHDWMKNLFIFDPEVIVQDRNFKKKGPVWYSVDLSKLILLAI